MTNAPRPPRHTETFELECWRCRCGVEIAVCETPYWCCLCGARLVIQWGGTNSHRLRAARLVCATLSLC
jgi:hypothetical protein